jgi:hypothetical protein
LGWGGCGFGELESGWIWLLSRGLVSLWYCVWYFGALGGEQLLDGLRVSI